MWNHIRPCAREGSTGRTLPEFQIPMQRSRLSTTGVRYSWRGSRNRGRPTVHFALNQKRNWDDDWNSQCPLKYILSEPLSQPQGIRHQSCQSFCKANLAAACLICWVVCRLGNWGGKVRGQSTVQGYTCAPLGQWTAVWQCTTCCCCPLMARKVNSAGIMDFFNVYIIQWRKAISYHLLPLLFIFSRKSSCTKNPDLPLCVVQVCAIHKICFDVRVVTQRQCTQFWEGCRCRGDLGRIGQKAFCHDVGSSTDPLRKLRPWETELGSKEGVVLLRFMCREGIGVGS